CQERDACSSRDVRVMESTFPACQEERYRVERLAAPSVHIGKSAFAAILVRVLVPEIVFLANVGAVPAARFHSVSARGGKGERSAGYQHDNRGHQNLLHLVASKYQTSMEYFCRLAVRARVDVEA